MPFRKNSQEEICFKIGGDFGGKGGVSVYMKNLQFFINVVGFQQKNLQYTVKTDIF